MQEHEPLIIHNRDGSDTIIDDPFSGIRSTYAALRKDPNAMPELSPESRERILEEIANGTAPVDPEDEIIQPVAADSAPVAILYRSNRHQRRKFAALARKERREKLKGRKNV